MRILLIEDEPDLGTAIKWALKQEKYLVDWAQDGAAGWAYLDSSLQDSIRGSARGSLQGSLQYSVVILDWMLPSLMGLEICQRLRAQQNPLPVLMLTAKDRTTDKVTALDAGADDYLVKPFEMEELLARLRALQRRSPHLQAQQIQLGPILLNYTHRSVAYQSGQQLQPIPLTHKEFQLLEYFMSHPQQFFNAEQLLWQLWETATDVSSNVVAAQMRLLRRKLAEQGCQDFIETVPNMGYRINPRYVS